MSFDNDLIPLPPPYSIEEFRNRLLEYKENVDLRKKVYARRSFNGFYILRKMILYAIRFNYFYILDYGLVEQFSDLEIVRKLFPSHQLIKGEHFTKTNHYKALHTIIINLRKLSECCLYIDYIEEAEYFARLNLVLCTKYFNDYFQTERKRVPSIYIENIGPKCLQLTYGVLGKIYIVKNDLDKAEEFINTGLLLGENSPALNLAKRFLEERKLQELNIGSIETDFRWEVIRYMENDPSVNISYSITYSEFAKKKITRNKENQGEEYFDNEEEKSILNPFWKMKFDIKSYDVEKYRSRFNDDMLYERVEYLRNLIDHEEEEQQEELKVENWLIFVRIQILKKENSFRIPVFLCFF